MRYSRGASPTRDPCRCGDRTHAFRDGHYRHYTDQRYHGRRPPLIVGATGLVASHLLLDSLNLLLFIFKEASKTILRGLHNGYKNCRFHQAQRGHTGRADQAHTISQNDLAETEMYGRKKPRTKYTTEMAPFALPAFSTRGYSVVQGGRQKQWGLWIGFKQNEDYFCQLVISREPGGNR